MGPQPVNTAKATRLATSATRVQIVRWNVALVFGIALAVSPPPARCADGPWNASIGATTDYVFRGVSQTYDSGALQLGVNYQSPQGWFAGAWSSNVDPYPFGATAVELDLYTGMRRALGDDFSATASYTHYAYLDDQRPGRYDYDEFALSASYLDELTATVTYEPDSTLYSDLGFARRRPSYAYELAARWPLPQGFALEAGAGYYDLHRLFGVRYLAGDAGVQFVYRRLTLDLTRYFADSTVGRLYEQAGANGVWVFSAVYHF
ncbi:MAG: TorF family putative porin [Steroidobacteraceae bacterium]|jgi:uncharacterized protein (TIGR02001 family)